MPSEHEFTAMAQPERLGRTLPDLRGSTDPLKAMGGVLDQPPVLITAPVSDTTRLTRRWRHGELHDLLPAMDAHVVITHYSASPHEAIWRNGRERLASRTRPGSVTIIPSGYEGRWDISGEVEISQVYLTDERLQAAAAPLTDGKAVELIGRAPFDDPIAGRVMAILSMDETMGGPAARLFVDQALDLLCTQLVRAHSSFAALPPPEPRRGLADWQIRKLISYVREHLDEEISLEDLARLVSLSRFHFIAAFRLALGQTPHEWVMKERVSRARLLLENRDLPVTEIALAVGYQTPSSFAAAFRKQVGATPSEFRKRL